MNLIPYFIIFCIVTMVLVCGFCGYMVYLLMKMTMGVNQPLADNTEYIPLPEVDAKTIEKAIANKTGDKRFTETPTFALKRTTPTNNALTKKETPPTGFESMETGGTEWI